ncbi:Beta-galactosidase [Firmicutes bacterium ASF500]|nr:Beta-galactosidase [Firmicutes bacterium ASF500]
MKADLNWLTDPTVFRVNRLDAHSDHVCYESPEEMATGKTSLRQSLDGMWRFAWSKRPADRPADFWQKNFDDFDFGIIQVPGHMELQGYGQIQYINTLYPWDGHAELRPPEIDWEDCPVGSYVREFDLEPGLLGKSVCISFQGAEQAIYVWLNGRFVGYAEDSFTPSDFDLTPYIREKGNRLCVEVYKRSSAAWIEDQDFFRFSGIFRSVYLYARPAVHLADLWLQAGLEEDNTTGTLPVRLLLEGEGSVHMELTHPIQGTLFDGDLELSPEGNYLRSQPFRFENIFLWDHDHPELYQATLTVTALDGTVTEVVPYSIGFRRFELKDGVMLLNGAQLMLNGVNRHEWNPDTGRAIKINDMTAAIDTFKRNHINTVRTCHYPNQTPWYHLCDQNGIYMMDEANLESHGSWQKLGKVEPSWNVPGSLPEWRDCVVDRAKSMFERDKNHVSILFWSCGNESYAGEDILAMADFFRANDPSRLVHYEGVFHCREFDRISDVESRMYASPENIRVYLKNSPKKPFLPCEYMHNMGNSLGGMESYIRLGEEFPQYQGGFIWDYMDQALWRTDVNGRRVLGYGGDFGDRQTDYAFSGNGIVFADGTEKPAMQEVRYWYASPAQRAAHDAANEQAKRALALPTGQTRKSPLRVIHGDGALGVRGEGFEILFSYPEGGPVSLASKSQEWLWRAPRPAYWRAPTENDRGNGFALKSSIWAAADSWQKCENIEILEESGERVCIRFTYTAPALPGLKTDVTYMVEDTGCITAAVHYHGGAGRPELPLFGLRFATPEPVETVEWLGLSGETYPDRKKGGVFGWHQEVPHIPAYLVPQECGCHVDTQAVILRNGSSRLTLEMADRPFAFSAIPYIPQQLEQAAHREELPDPVRTVVTVCGAMRGVGGIDSWSSDVEEAYHISGEADQEFSFSLWL